MCAVPPEIPAAYNDIRELELFAKFIVDAAAILPAGFALPIVPYKTPVDPFVEALSCPITKYLAVDVVEVIVEDPVI